MGKTNQLGVLADVFTSDASNNVGIGGSPSGSYKLEVTGTAKVSSTLLVSGAATFSSTVNVNGATATTNLNVLGVAGTMVGTTATNQQLRITAPTTTANAGAGIRFDASSGAKEATANIGVVNNATGNTGSLVFNVYNGGADFPEQMRITSTGNVGIGTTNTDPLSLGREKNLAIVTTGTNAALTIVGGGAARIDFGVGSTRTGGIYSDSTNFMEIFTNTALPIVFSPNASQAMRITSGGNVGIGTTGPSYQLQLSTDSAAKPTSALWTIASDERIKENINPYKKGLQELLKINPITYDYNGLGGFVKGKGGVGIIAQEIIDILPDSVSSIKAKLNKTDEDETNILNFNGHELIYVLINSIKEQQAIITSLQDRLDKAGL